MAQEIHPTAIVDASADLGADVVIGPYVVVGPQVMIGDGTRLGPHVVIERNTTLGRRCAVGAGSILGAAPQDRKFRHAETRLEIGDDTVIREYSTLHLGTEARGCTLVGSGVYLMTYVHVAHDCLVEDGVTIANMVQLAGHVTVEAHATISGICPVHQFVRIGTWAHVGGGSRVAQDVPPYTQAVGTPLRLYGLNTTGLIRAGFSAETRLALKHAYRLLFNSDMTTSEAVEHLRRDAGAGPEVRRLVEFVARSERGVLV